MPHKNAWVTFEFRLNRMDQELVDRVISGGWGVKVVPYRLRNCLSFLSLLPILHDEETYVLCFDDSVRFGMQFFLPIGEKGEKTTKEVINGPGCMPD